MKYNLHDTFRDMCPTSKLMKERFYIKQINEKDKKYLCVYIGDFPIIHEFWREENFIYYHCQIILLQ
jgi:hypothetical protein